MRHEVGAPTHKLRASKEESERTMTRAADTEVRRASNGRREAGRTLSGGSQKDMVESTFSLIQEPIRVE